MAFYHVDLVAEDDLRAIAKDIAREQHNPHAARDLIDECHRKCEMYARHPEMDDLRNDLGEAIRTFTFKRSYVVIYRPLEDGIDVLRVFHGARDDRRLFRQGGS